MSEHIQEGFAEVNGQRIAGMKKPRCCTSQKAGTLDPPRDRSEPPATP